MLEERILDSLDFLKEDGYVSDDKIVLNHFDSIFKTQTIKNINFDNMRFLSYLFKSFQDELYTPSKKYTELLRKHINIADELEKTFSKKQMQLFEQFCETKNEMYEEENEQLFLFGYIISKELDSECKMRRD